MNSGQWSPFKQFHDFEAIDFGPGTEFVHGFYWPVLNRKAWAVEMDNLGFPLVSGRTILSPQFGAQFSRMWSADFEGQLRRRFASMLAGYEHPSCKAIFFCCQEALEEAAGWIDRFKIGEAGARFLKKSRVLYPAQSPLPEKAMERKWSTPFPMRIVFCGRSFEDKSGDMALRIFSALHKQPGVHLTYIGEIPAAARQQYGRMLERIEYVARCSHDDVLDIFRSSHILFHPSQYESLGVVFFEAAAAGMAIVCAQGKGMPDLARIFGEHGAGFIYRDRLNGMREEVAFQDYLTWLLQYPARARAMAMANYRCSVDGPLSLVQRNNTLSQIYAESDASDLTEVLSPADLQRDAEAGLREISARELQELLAAYRSELQSEGQFRVRLSHSVVPAATDAAPLAQP